MLKRLIISSTFLLVAFVTLPRIALAEPCVVEDPGDEYTLKTSSKPKTFRDFLEAVTMSHKPSSYKVGEAKVDNKYSGLCEDGEDENGYTIRRIVLKNLTIEVQSKLPPIFVGNNNTLIIEAEEGAVIDGTNLTDESSALFLGLDIERYFSVMDISMSEEKKTGIKEELDAEYGNGKIVIVGAEIKNFKGSAITIASANAEIIEAKIENNGTAGQPAISIISDGARITRSEISGSGGSGIFIDGGKHHIISLNEITGSGESVDADYRDGITVYKIENGDNPNVMVLDNEISYNAGSGISVHGSSKDVAIMASRFFGNKSPKGGIDLVDEGANEGMKPLPVISVSQSKMVLSTEKLVQGADYVLELFSASSKKEGDAGEGEKFIEQVLFTADSAKRLSVEWPEDFDKGEMVTWTVRETLGSTSEFSTVLDPKKLIEEKKEPSFYITPAMIAVLSKKKVDPKVIEAAGKFRKIPELSLDDGVPDEGTPDEETEGGGKGITEEDVGHKSEINSGKQADQSGSSAGCSLNAGTSDSSVILMLTILILALTIIRNTRCSEQ